VVYRLVPLLDGHWGMLIGGAWHLDVRLRIPKLLTFHILKNEYLILLPN